MKNFLKMLFIWTAISLSQLNAHETCVSENNGKIEACNQCEELVCYVTTADLVFDEENISVNIEGSLYPVRALEKSGNQWIARIAGRLYGYCRKGHDLCPYGKCHTRLCPYEIKRCICLGDK